MVKMQGPLHSAAASGSVGQAITLLNNKSRAVMKRHARPKNPRTDRQTPIRAAVKFLAQNWRSLTPAQKATWRPHADVKGTAPYHAFLGKNMKRWANFRPPAKEDPAAETPPAPDAPVFTATGQFHAVKLQIRWLGGAEAWANIVYRSKLMACPPILTNVTAILLQPGPIDFTWFEYDMSPGIWYYKLQRFTPSGLPGPVSTRRTAFVT